MINLNGMSLRELARNMNVSVQYLSDVFKGKRTINEKRINQLVELVPNLKGKFRLKESRKTYLYKE